MKKIMLASLVGFVTLSGMGIGSVEAQEIQDTKTKETTATIVFEENKEPLKFISATSDIDFGTEDFHYGPSELQPVRVGGVNVEDLLETKFQIKIEDSRIGNNQKWSLKVKAEGASDGTNALVDGTEIIFGPLNVESDYYGKDEKYLPQNKISDAEQNLNIVVTTTGEGSDGTKSVLEANREGNPHQGLGAWTVDFDPSNIELSIGSDQKALMSAEAGTYSTIITWTLSDGL